MVVNKKDEILHEALCKRMQLIIYKTLEINISLHVTSKS